MATIPQAMTAYIRAIKQDPTALSELRDKHPNVSQLRSLFQGVEDWFEIPANRLAMKAAMEAEAGITITNTFAKKIGRVWMQLKWKDE